MLIQGEAGTGKSLVARVLHARSGRTGELVRVDVRGLGADAAEALARAAGEARDGTLFLDEVAELSAAAQARLLALLDANPDLRVVSSTRSWKAWQGFATICRRSSTRSVFAPRLDARGGKTAAGALRPSVRPPLWAHAQAARSLRDRPVGNPARAAHVRGLRRNTERAVVSDADVLTAADFAPPASGPPGAAAGDFNLARSERAIVEAALKRHGHNVSHAARELGLTRAALYRRMVKHGL